jgi:hypothetical protein
MRMDLETGDMRVFGTRGTFVEGHARAMHVDSLAAFSPHVEIARRPYVDGGIGDGTSRRPTWPVKAGCEIVNASNPSARLRPSTLPDHLIRAAPVALQGNINLMNGAEREGLPRANCTGQGHPDQLTHPAGLA